MLKNCYIFSIVLIVFSSLLPAFAEPASPEHNFPDGYQRFTDNSPLHHNQWELYIYRPVNSDKMNITRCWLKLEDTEGNDVTYTACKATYYFPDQVVKDPKEGLPYFSSIFHHTGPRTVYKYQRTYYLDGGMVMHLTLKPGKYKISFYTPEDQHFFVKTQNKEWTSNIFEYDTQNPTKVIFVSPIANENGFYTGGWHISGYAPEFFKFTKPKQ